MEFPEAVYHVMSRGNEKSVIFRDDRDRRTFLAILASVIRKERWLLHSFCLLGNHYHLLVETPLGKLSHGMHGLNGHYTQQFNRRHERAGHLFEGRFKAIVVEKESHLLELHRYIVLNPVRAGLAATPEDWAWSSYRATCGRSAAPPWLEVRWTLGQFGADGEGARTSYMRFVARGMSKFSEPVVHAQLFVGRRSFVASMSQRLRDRVLGDEIPFVQRRPCPPTLAEISAAVAREWKVPATALARRRAGEPRIAAIYLAVRAAGSTAREIGSAFGIKRGRVSNIVRDVERGRLRRLRGRLQAVEEILKGEGGGSTEVTDTATV